MHGRSSILLPVRTVDCPQPDGPIRAVTRFFEMSRPTSAQSLTLAREPGHHHPFALISTGALAVEIGRPAVPQEPTPIGRRREMDTVNTNSPLAPRHHRTRFYFGGQNAACSASTTVSTSGRAMR